VPSFGANQGAYTPTNLATLGATSMTTGGATSGGAGTNIGGTAMTQSQLQSMHHELAKTYGSGLATAIMNFLQGGAGFNQDAINNLFAALQPGTERGTESLMEQFSASGNRFGSGAQIGLADYLSQVQLNEGQIETEMYEQSVSNYINTLMGAANTTAGRIASSPSTLDTIGNLIGTGATGASALTSAISPNADTSILDAIAGLGGL
jgi:hypothetical protein